MTLPPHGPPEITEAQQAATSLGEVEDPTPDNVSRALQDYSPYAVASAAASLGASGGGGGGSRTLVSCLLACNADFDIHDLGSYDVLWDALYDNFWDQNVLTELPAGLGLTFAFDGSSSLIVPTETGVWALSYVAQRAGDANWFGAFRLGGVGINIPWVQQRRGTLGATDIEGDPDLVTSLTLSLPSGTQLTHQVTTTLEGSNVPSNVSQVWLSIVRLG